MTSPQQDSAVPEPQAAPEAPAAAPAVPAGSAEAEQIRSAYAFDGARIHLGALVADGGAGEPDPSVPVNLSVAMLNRHGLIAGATGTGKTRTLQVIAEQAAHAGAAVFVADMKGDLSGIAVPGAASEKLTARAAARGQEWVSRAAPTEFYTLGGQGEGVPIRTTVSDFGPVLMSKVLELNETQESSLGLIFHYADAQGLALLDLKDLRALIQFLTSDEGKGELKGIGGISSATAGVILRSLTAFEASGADVFFGEPAFDTQQLLRTQGGTGIISCLELPGVASRPALFSTFMMWMLAELYQELPEVGDAEVPKLVFFFDEAHLLFKDASKAFLDQVVQTVRLIRSKGVGIFFITQTPKDIPGDVLAQLGNRVQHALRAFTPDDAKALKATAKTFPTSEHDLEEVIPALGTGEAIVTVMSEDGAPTPVAITAVRAPESSMEPAGAEVITAAVAASPLQAQYGTAVDNESAYEILQQRAAKEAEAQDAAAGKGAGPAADGTAAPAERAAKPAAKTASKDEGFFQNPAVKSFLRSAGTVLGREITRGLFGTRRRR
ncbi:helicase HerA-like domain-containing protein [Brachybacterium sp. J144]|uniref:helicase HerA-like domain-containing protein n=1 Tax=Brachybacterium sp. J144 TaxID=3116487 RepID=UPI002E760966|nr:helicase HerA-like domain-containing protein [Brachybacterium sp. J144]MEE1651673.1 helicase HerA-like domain-containing protein [Brachybacterium sp. J144]